MKYIKIKNNGLMEEKALSLVGASTKVNDTSKIGQFGSGNKYAIAYLLRNDYELRVFSGEREIEFATEPVVFRANTFNVLFINGEKTSITTEMGKDWHFWQAMREIYCNALDEEEPTFNIVERIEPAPEETHFYVSLEKDAEEFVKNFDSYFATNKKVLFECSKGRILEKTGDTANFYRKGIKCHITKSQSIFDYDFTTIKIDENRLISYTWEIDEYVWDIIFQCDNEEVLKKIFFSLSGDYIEKKVSSVSSIHSWNMSETCKKFVKTLKVVPEGFAGLLKPDEQQEYLKLPTKIFEEIRSHLNNENLGDCFKVYQEGIYREIDPDSLQEGTIENSFKFLKECDFFVPYLIKVGIFANKAIMGCVEGENIVLSEVCLEKGVTEVINTVIEEFIHIKYGAKDSTRGFQYAIITEFISYMKKRVGK